jgi:hypothetical protein
MCTERFHVSVLLSRYSHWVSQCAHDTTDFAPLRTLFFALVQTLAELLTVCQLDPVSPILYTCPHHIACAAHGTDTADLQRVYTLVRRLWQSPSVQHRSYKIPPLVTLLTHIFRLFVNIVVTKSKEPMGCNIARMRQTIRASLCL